MVQPRLPRTARVALGVIIAVAAAARLWGIGFGLPHSNARPDEGAIAAIATGIYHGDLNPHVFNYPALFMLVIAAVLLGLSALVRLAHYLPIHWSLEVAATTTTYRVARLLSAAAGIASVLMIFRIGHRLFGRTTALASAALLSLAFLHVRDSHFGVTDVPMTFMVLVAFLFIVRLSESGSASDLIAAGVTAGLATSTKYNAALVALPALLVIFAVPVGVEQPIPQRMRRAALFGSLMTAAFLLTSPYSVLDFRRFLADVTFESQHLAQGHGIVLSRGWNHHMTSTLRYGVGVPILSAGILGLLLLLWRDPRKGSLVALFPVSYYVLLGSGYTVFARYMLPVVPFLCLTAGYAVTEAAGWLAARLRRPNWAPLIVTAGVAGLLWPSAQSVVTFDRLIARTDNRLLARGWVERQFPRGTRIGQLGIESGRPFQQDPNEVKFEIVTFRRRGPRPDLVIVQSSPLERDRRVVARVEDILSTDYELAFARDGVGADPDNVYDWQDEFYLPLTGFRGIERPGPNLKIYIRRGEPAVRRMP